jgi:O-antigen/teichoic acid export membrane protein
MIKEGVEPHSSNTENNKRIAKNTLFLYFRSVLTLGAGLYTSREVLSQLGVSDFGVYNVVGGVIVLFGFIQSAMNVATSRFFTFDLGKGDFERLKKTFGLSLVIHIFTALLILILGETAGLWFLNTQLVIPAQRMEAANFVYQFTIFTACVGILQVPYMVAITAHERMKVFAYAGIADAVFKLAVAVALGFAPFDKLKFYSVLLFGVFVTMNGFYYVYCRKNFKETRFKWFWDKKMFWERMGFGGWTMLQGTSAIAALQGVNMLLNAFHGVIANAAYGIMTQVSGAVTQFSTNLMAAFNPQVIKSYAKNDLDYLHNLIFRFSRISFLSLSLFIIPIVMNMDFVLHLWLKEVPDFAIVFCQIRLVDHLFVYAFSGLLSTAISASGKIKFFTIIDSILVVMNFILCYILFRLNFSPATVPIVYIITNIARIISINLFAKRLIYLSIRKFGKKALFRQFTIALISFPLPIWLHFNINDPIASFFASSLSFLCLFLPSAYFLGLENNERILLKNKIRSLTAK